MVASLSTYSPISCLRVTPEASLAGIKTFCETNGLLETPVYPSYLPCLQVLQIWLTKAIQARDASIIYSKEVDKLTLEVIDE